MICYAVRSSFWKALAAGRRLGQAGLFHASLVKRIGAPLAVRPIVRGEVFLAWRISQFK